MTTEAGTPNCDMIASAFSFISGSTRAPEIERLFSKVPNKDFNDDDFDVDGALSEKTISKLGDNWEIGKYRFICGDSTIAETYEKFMDGREANLYVTDPLYGVFYEGTAGTIQNDSLKDDEFYKFLFDAFRNIEEHLTNDSSIYIFHADTKGHLERPFKMEGFIYQEYASGASNHWYLEEVRTGGCMSLASSGG